MKAFLKSVKKDLICKAIFLFDFVQDYIKIRFIIPLCILFFLYTTASSIFQSDPEASPYPETLKVVLDPTPIIYIGEGFSRYPIVRITDQNSDALPNATVNISVSKAIIKTENTLINCDSDFLNYYAWTFIHLRSLKPCKIVLENPKAITDFGGYAKFSDFKIRKGNEGYYTFKIKVDLNEEYFAYKEICINLISPINEIKVLTNQSKSAQIGVPLSPQPIILLLNQFGNPVENKTVDAITSPYGSNDDNFYQLYDLDSDKFAVLEGDSSKPSTSEGKAEFTSLKIMGSTHLNVYILFSVDGTGKIVPWMTKNKGTKQSLLKNYFPPIVMDYQNQIHATQFLRNPSSDSLEGLEFEVQPIIHITNGNNQDVTGIMCFALLKKFNKHLFPGGYNLVKHLFLPKMLVKPITGSYKIGEPYFEYSFNSIFSSKTGSLEFEGLGITTSGNIEGSTSTAKIQYFCGNAKYLEFETEISSSVKSITIYNMDSMFSLSSDPAQNPFYLSILVEDENSSPVRGKVLNSVSLLDSKQKKDTNSKVNLIHYFTSELSEYYTNVDGYMIFYLTVSQIKVFESTYFLQLEIDGINNIIDTNQGIFITGSIPTGVCQSVELVETEDINSAISLKDSEDVELEFQLYDGSIDEIDLEPSFSFFPDSIITKLFPYQNINTMYYYYSLNTVSVQANQGKITISSFSLRNSISGSYLAYLLGDSSNSDFTTLSEVCTTITPLLFEYKNSIASVSFSDSTLNNFNSNPILRYSDESISLSLIIKGEDSSPLPSFEVSLNVIIYEFPEIYSALLYNDDSSFKATPASSQTDSSGVIQVVISFNKKYPGNWVIGILANGISSTPLSISIINSQASISIVSSNPSQNLRLLSPISPPFQLKVSVLDPKYISDVPLIAFFSPVNSSIQVSIDVDNIDSCYTIWNSHRMSWTDDSGKATFDYLTVLSISNTPSYTTNSVTGFFYFTLATNLNIRSQSSAQFTFTKSFDLFPYPFHDTVISYLSSFVYPITAMFQIMQEDSLLIETFPLLFSIRVSYFISKSISFSESKSFSTFLFQGNVCLLLNGKSQDAGSCPSQIISNTKSEINIAKIKYTNLILNKKTIFGIIDLVLCFYDFCLYSNQELNSLKIQEKSFYVSLSSNMPSKVDPDYQYFILATIKDNKGNAIPYSEISCNVYAIKNEKLISNNLNTIINAISQPETDIYNTINASAGFSSFEDSYTQKLTDYFGNVLLTFQFDQVVTDYHSIICSSSNANPISTNVFFLENHINKITIIDDEEISLKIKFNSKNPQELLPTNVSLGKKLKISLTSSGGYKFKELEEYIGIEIGNKEYYEYVTKQTPEESSTIDILIKILDILTKGSSSIFHVDEKKPLKKFKVTLTPIEDEYEISNIVFEAKQPDEYRMRIYFFGLYSPFSKHITIENLEYFDFFSFCNLYSIWIYLASIILIIISNSIYLQFFALLFSSLIVSFDIIIFIASNLQSYVVLISGIVILAFLLFIIVLMIIFNIKYGESSNFYKIKSEITKIYSLNKLKSVSLDKSKSDLEETFRIALKETSQKHFFQETERSEEEDISTKRGVNGDIRIKKTCCQNLKDKLSSIFCFNSQDAFYYPQRFIMAIFVGVFTIIFCIFKEIALSNQIINFIGSVKTSFTITIFTTLQTILYSFRDKLAFELTNENLESYTQTINEIDSFLISVQKGLFAATIVSNIIISLIYLATIYLAMKKFKRMCIKARKTNKVYESLEEFELEEVYEFTGHLLGNTAMSYIFVCVLITFVFTILFHPLFWIFLWNYRMVIFVIVFSAFMEEFIKGIVNFFIYKKDGTIVVNRNLLQILEIVQLIMAILDGLFFSILRILFSFIFFVIRLIRFDETIFPSWLPEIPLVSDKVFICYMSSIKFHILFNNPIFCFATDELIFGEKKNICRSYRKIWKTVKLIEIPSLCKLKRKKNNL